MRGRWSRPGNCALCGIPREGLHRDHIVPKSLGGSDEPENIQMICANCHEDKTAIDMRTIMKGRRPSAATIEKFRISATGRRHSEETKRRVSIAKRGIPKSPEHRAKLSAALVIAHREGRAGHGGPRKRAAAES